MTTQAIPTVQILKSDDRGQADHGWLKARHSFSFANYYNPEQMGFRSLRVINQDRIAGGGGFPTHPHRDMEIFTYVLSGALNHKDSMGNEGCIRPGQIQLMSAGSGVTHSEFNGSSEEEASLLQIWITPERQGLTPSYTDWTPNAQQRNDKMALLISPDGRDQSATIHQDAYIYRIKLEAGESVSHDLKEGRGAWVQLIKGKLRVNNAEISVGDAAFMEENGSISLTAIEHTEALFFDLK
ncbi:pirin family protein [Rubritalea profundi]|uniref:Quercetin 2,3-dioxygenase n=1 Tax=Rubritalea profundi TaxID=1658618 RepID=A0A2S7TZY3_9BACT|nr:pirin family protein [Rubritalea profundi]PQJ28306.1 quercetin 2,3-dioxygenase [Rubritalea profundi]